ncbi:MAG: hypothetical protein H7A55_19580 [Verrucomicrobiaceae bacterium]|nr:hypothetical protein [Verrucomicrobiaceae bacterium]
MEARPPPPIAKTVFMIWMALLTSTILLVFVADAATPAEKPAGSGLAVPLMVVGGINIMVSFLVRMFMLAPFTDGRASWHDEKQTGRFATGNIVCFALSESAAVLGLVMRMTGEDPTICAALFVAAIMAMVLHAPLAWRFQPRT